MRHRLATPRDERDQLERVLRAPANVTRIERELLAYVQEWRTMASRTVAQGRQILRKLLRGRVTATPLDDGRVELSGQADYGKLFSGIFLATAVASGNTETYFELPIVGDTRGRAQ